MNLTVNLGKQTYTIYIDNGILAHAGEYVRKVFNGQKIMIISDDNVFPLYGTRLLNSLEGYECHTLVLPHGETTKRFQTLPAVYSALLNARLTRSDLVIALGGGVIGDLAGLCGRQLSPGCKSHSDPHFSPGSGRLICRRKGCRRPSSGEKSCGSLLPPRNGANRSRCSGHATCTFYK